jgi:tetratricopeptide (TPR) repeat protein
MSQAIPKSASALPKTGVRLSTAWSHRASSETAILWCILAVTLVVYLRCLSNGFVLDDAALIVKNSELHHWSFLWKAFTREEFWYSDADFLPHFRNYRPLLLVWYWIDYQLFGLSPAPWHASVVAVHLLAVWLVFKICRRLAGESTAALVAAAAFALTPVHVAAVVWMSGSGFALATALDLGAFYLVMPRAEGAARNWVIAIALYAGALLCHESAIALPALIACYAFIFDPGDSGTGDAAKSSTAPLWMRVRRAVVWMAPFAVVLILYLVARRLVIGFYVSNPYDYANLLTETQDVLTVPLVFATYLTLLVMPWLTLPNHRVPPVSSLVSPEFWGPLAAIVLIGVVFVLVAMHHPRRLLHLFCAAWMVVTLAPMMILHSVYHLVQDYYLYLPSVGWCILIGDVVALVARTNALGRRLAFGGALAMLLVYALVLWQVEPYWHDDVAAARGYVEGCPEATSWHLTLAVYLEQEGDLAQAEKEIRTAIRLEPDKTGTIHPRTRDLHLVLGELLARRGDIDGAALEFAKGISGPADEDEGSTAQRLPSYGQDGFSLYSSGVRDGKTGRVDQGISEMSKGLEIMSRAPVPDYGPIAARYVPLAELYDSIGNQKQVDAILREVDSMPVGGLAAGLARARIMLNHSDKEGAERILRDLSERYPGNAQVLIALGDVQADLKENEHALASYQGSIPNAIGKATLHASIARVLHAMGRDREALDQCRLTQALGPRDWTSQFSCAEIRNAIQTKSN